MEFSETKLTESVGQVTVNTPNVFSPYNIWLTFVCRETNSVSSMKSKFYATSSFSPETKL